MNLKKYGKQEEFYYKKSYLEHRLQKDVMENGIAYIPLEFFYVLFWLFADSLVRYLFVENYDYRNDKIRAGRIASMEVEFGPIALSERVTSLCP